MIPTVVCCSPAEHMTVALVDRDVAGPLLVLEASTYAASVAVVDGSVVRASRRAMMRGETEERLMPAVAEALREAGVTPAALGGIVCGAGPGSFTSLRIAAAIAKGIAEAHDLPLFACDSLWLAVAAAGSLGPGRWAASLDAMRGDVHAAAVEIAASGAREVVASALVPADAFDGWTREQGAVALASGVTPDASGLVLDPGWTARRGPVDRAGWEPEYGRKAEAQVRWERDHGRVLPVT